MATVTTKGQITFPMRVRNALGLEAGSRVTFEVRDGQVTLRKEVPERVLVHLG